MRIEVFPFEAFDSMLVWREAVESAVRPVVVVDVLGALMCWEMLSIWFGRSWTA